MVDAGDQGIWIDQFGRGYSVFAPDYGIDLFRCMLEQTRDFRVL